MKQAEFSLPKPNTGLKVMESDYLRPKVMKLSRILALAM
jgi:hypothetical protein